jgi:hypothetical protein
MIITVKRLIAIGMIFSAVSISIFGQTDEEELSVEESYLQQSIELMIIREQSRADSREMKMVALEYIEDAMDNGNTGEEIRQALEFLALEGSASQVREGGRLLNNYPDVRKRAVEFLGEMGTEEAKNTILKVLLADNETMVLTEAVKALGNISVGEQEKTAEAIAWVVTRFDVLNPDNLLALSALDAFEKIAETNNGIRNPAALRTIFRIADGPYINPVRNRARELISSMRKYNTTDS